MTNKAAPQSEERFRYIRLAGGNYLCDFYETQVDTTTDSLEAMRLPEPLAKWLAKQLSSTDFPRAVVVCDYKREVTDAEFRSPSKIVRQMAYRRLAHNELFLTGRIKKETAAALAAFQVSKNKGD